MKTRLNIALILSGAMLFLSSTLFAQNLTVEGLSTLEGGTSTGSLRPLTTNTGAEGMNTIGVIGGNSQNKFINFRAGGASFSSTGIMFSSFSSDHFFMYRTGNGLSFRFSNQNSDLPSLTSTTEYMVLSTNGNVGIGETNPTSKLDVNGDTKITGKIDVVRDGSTTIIGSNAGGATGSVQNTFVGHEAGRDNAVGGVANTFIGEVAGRFNTTGSRNVFLGQFAGIASFAAGSTTGADNTFVGVGAGGSNTTGSLNATLGRAANVSTGNLSTATAIGALSSVNASNKMQLGASTTTLSTSGGYTIVSDGRFKKEVKNDIEGLDFIMNLKPVSYRFDYQQYDDFLRGEKGSKDLSEAYKQQLKEKTKERELGFIAQEVANTADEMNIPFNGVYRPQNENDNYALDYGRLSVPLVKATQEQQAEIEALKEENTALKQRLSKIEAMLSGKVEVNTITSKLTDATLKQNAPNPFTEATNISYFIPEGTKSASLQVMDQNGRIIKRIPIQATGNGQLTLQANLLSAGTYSYSLILDGQVMETKQMVLTH